MNTRDELLDVLHRWLPAQRWYPAKGRGARLQEVGRLPLSRPGGPEVVSHLIGVDSADGFDVVQVPLVHRRAPVPGRDPVGEVNGRHVYDGPHDPAYVAALSASLVPAGGQSPPAPDAPARVLEGEQSNTSIVVGAQTSRPLIVKVFRTVEAGRNPDVEVLGALSGAGCREVPTLVGWQEGAWRDRDGRHVTGDLAVATEFLPGSQDAWRVAQQAARHGDDFTGPARDLGATTARVHVELRRAFGSTSASPSRARELVEGLQGRVDWALAAADVLAPHRQALRRHRDALTRLPEPPALQRVHGDYHLGQVLHSPGRGWVLLDFEGEPLRPLAERTRPDLALRDVVGMLRSFDYAAGHVALTDADRASAAARWAQDGARAFRRGYAAVAGEDPQAAHPELFKALMLDKALYEVVYETRNRPRWVDIPLRAVVDQITNV